MSFVLRIKDHHYREEDDDFYEINRKKQATYDPSKDCGVVTNEEGKLKKSIIF